MTKPRVLTQNMVCAQVCVPAEWTNEQVLEFLTRKTRSIAPGGRWRIRTAADERAKRTNDMERVPCGCSDTPETNDRHCHIVCDAFSFEEAYHKTKGTHIPVPASQPKVKSLLLDVIDKMEKEQYTDKEVHDVVTYLGIVLMGVYVVEDEHTAALAGLLMNIKSGMELAIKPENNKAKVKDFDKPLFPQSGTVH